MGIAIQCVLQQRVPGIPHLEGKSLAAAYCAGSGPGAASGGNIIAIDFKNGQVKPSRQSIPASDESLLTPLDAFMVKDDGVRWHDAAKGLVAVKGILERIRHGAKMSMDPSFGFGGDEQELMAGLKNDLEDLQQILASAQKMDTRFCLAFDV